MLFLPSINRELLLWVNIYHLWILTGDINYCYVTLHCQAIIRHCIHRIVSNCLENKVQSLWYHFVSITYILPVIPLHDGCHLRLSCYYWLRSVILFSLNYLIYNYSVWNRQSQSTGVIWHINTDITLVR
jgi:hypothetical protein